MAVEQFLEDILKELRDKRTPPLVTHGTGSIQYVVFGAIEVEGKTGYPILRITELLVDEHVRIDSGFLLESDRGSTDLKADHAGSLTLLNAVTYG